MAEESKQLELEFPSTEDFPEFDEVEDSEAQTQIPVDGFDEMKASDSEGGCCFGE